MSAILLFCLLLDLLAVCGSVFTILLVVLSIPTQEEIINVLISSGSKETVINLRTCMVVGLILLVFYLIISILNLFYSLSLLLPAWSMPRCMVYMKKVAMMEYITSTCNPKKKGKEKMAISKMILSDEIK